MKTIMYSTLAMLLTITTAFAEMHFELNFAHTSVDYVVYPELSATNPSPATVHKVESPNGRIWKDTDGNGNSEALIWTNSFEDLLFDCTNGLWTLILNEGDPSAETNWFSVSASNFNAATFGDPDITYPVDWSTISNNQPTLEWTGPSHLPSLFIWMDGDTTPFREYDWLDSGVTSWTPSTTLPADSYSSYVNYEHKDYKDVFTSIPTNATGTALSDWTTKFSIASYNWSHFTVVAPPLSLGIALDAYYLPWTTGGDADWFPQTYETMDGIDAAQSGSIGLGETSWIETTVANEGIMQYLMQLIADEGDYVEITINGNFYESIDGPYGGGYYGSDDLYAGDTIRWTFYNDDDTGGGQDAAFLDRVEFGEDESLGMAVDAPQFEWITGGEEGWSTEWFVSDDIDAAICGFVSPDGESWIETTIEDPGSLTFMWNIETMEGEALIFELNGNEHGRIESGDYWEPYSLDLPTGPNTLRWTFVNDATEMSGPAFLDQVFFTPTGAVEPDYEADMDFRIARIRVGTNDAFFSIYPSFNDYEPSSSTIEVVSPNELSGGSHHVTWHNVFNTLQDAIDECEAGPWTIYYDRDTPEEKTFTFNVSLPEVSTNDLPPVFITSPVQDAVGVSPNPDYTWTGPTNYTSLRTFIYNEEQGGYVGIQSMPSSATSWTNAPTAPEVTNRFFVIYYDYSYGGIDISEPLDVSSNPLNSWNESTWLESQHRITYEVGSSMVPTAVTLLPPMVMAGDMGLSFLSQSGTTHFVEWSTNLITGPWMPATNFPGDGTTHMITLPTTNPAAYYRIETQ